MLHQAVSAVGHDPMLLAAALWDTVLYAIGVRFVGRGPIYYWQHVQSTGSTQQWE